MLNNFQYVHVSFQDVNISYVHVFLILSFIASVICAGNSEGKHFSPPSELTVIPMWK